MKGLKGILVLILVVFSGFCFFGCDLGGTEADDFSQLSESQSESQLVPADAITAFAGYEGPRGYVRFSAGNDTIRQLSAIGLQNWKLKLAWVNIGETQKEEIPLSSGSGCIDVPVGFVTMQLTAFNYYAKPYESQMEFLALGQDVPVSIVFIMTPVQITTEAGFESLIADYDISSYLMGTETNPAKPLWVRYYFDSNVSSVVTQGMPVYFVFDNRINMDWETGMKYDAVGNMNIEGGSCICEVEWKNAPGTFLISGDLRAFISKAPIVARCSGIVNSSTDDGLTVDMGTIRIDNTGSMQSGFSFGVVYEFWFRAQVSSPHVRVKSVKIIDLNDDESDGYLSGGEANVDPNGVAFIKLSPYTEMRVGTLGLGYIEANLQVLLEPTGETCNGGEFMVDILWLDVSLLGDPNFMLYSSKNGVEGLPLLINKAVPVNNEQQESSLPVGTLLLIKPSNTIYIVAAEWILQGFATPESFTDCFSFSDLVSYQESGLGKYSYGETILDCHLLNY